MLFQDFAPAYLIDFNPYGKLFLLVRRILSLRACLVFNADEHAKVYQRTQRCGKNINTFKNKSQQLHFKKVLQLNKPKFKENIIRRCRRMLKGNSTYKFF